jgi:hypothetical protein
MKALIAFAIGCSLATGAWAAGVTVVKVSGNVRLQRDFADPPIDGTVAIGMPLNDADELFGESPDASIQLECASGATQTLSERFDAIINSATARTKCAVDLNAGTVVATVAPDSPGDATGDPSVQGGPYALLAKHTQFGLTVVRGEPDATNAFVIEGEATVEKKTDQSSQTLTDGQFINYRAAVVTPIPGVTLKRVAIVYARLDASQLGAAATPAVQAELRAKWYSALSHPKDEAARSALTQSYKTYNLDASAIGKYQTWRSTKLHGAEYYVAPQAAPAGGHGAAAAAVVPPAAVAQPYGHGHGATMGAAMAVQPASRTFENPVVGNERLDFCLHWGTECGQPAADAFCRSQNYARASNFTIASDVGAQTPTRVIGDNAVCSDPGCDAIATVICTN